ncbi:MAG: excisionase family DNA-binding protein [Thiohalomonadaceae bacterium]
MATRRFTTGEVGRYCGVHFRTVLRWIDAGKLKAHRLPGPRGEYRVCLPDLIAFLHANRLPVPPELLGGGRTVLVVGDAESAAAPQSCLREANFECHLATDGLQAGMLLQRLAPAVMILCPGPADSSLDLLRSVRALPSLHGLKVLVISPPGASLEQAHAEGADDVLQDPFEDAVLVRKVYALVGEAA